MSSVQIRDVRKSFGGFEVLHGVSIPIEDGAFVVLVGPSGCGKSTLLRVVANLLAPTSGTLNGKRSNVAFVFQQPTLLPWRTVEKNVRLPLEIRGRLRDEDRTRVASVIETVGLSEFRRFYPNQLSGGMQMRVSLARALVNQPDLLLLDEPFAALDDITRQRLNEELLTLWQRSRFTALFVTHNVSEAVYLSHRVLVMSARPGTFLRDIPVPFPHPRPFELRAEPEFARLCGDVSASLRETCQ